MPLPITLTYAAIFALFAMILSARAGLYRGRKGLSILYGDPVDMELAQRVRVHQNFLEYVPMILIMMAGIEAVGGSHLFLYVCGDLLIIARIAHAIGLKHDKMAHPGRTIGAGGTALITVAMAVYGLWIAVPRLPF